MKCPKCGYISFDYTQACPKCNRDTTVEREKLKLPSFKPATLSLLGGLIGETIRPDMGTEMHEAEAASGLAQAFAVSPEELYDIESMEKAFEKDNDFEIEFEPAPDEGLEESLEPVDLAEFPPETPEEVIQKQETPMDLSLESSSEELSLDIDDFIFEGPETGFSQAEETNQHKIALDPDLPSPERVETEEISLSAPTEGKEEEFFLDLDDLITDEPEVGSAQKIYMEDEEESRVDLKELASMVQELTEDSSIVGAESDAATQQSQDVSPSPEALSGDEDLSPDLDFLELELELEKTDDESP